MTTNRKIAEAGCLSCLCKSGFTLIELIVTMGAVSVLAGSLFGLFAGTSRNYRALNSEAWLINDGRAIIDLIFYDIRMAGLDPLGIADAGFKEISASKVRFTADRNMDGNITNDDEEEITYKFDSAKKSLKQCLYETEGGNSCQTLLENIVKDFTLEFYDLSNNIALIPDNVKYVSISLTLEESGNEKGHIIRTLKTKIASRNS